jgi:hypothetical protein
MRVRLGRAGLRLAADGEHRQFLHLDRGDRVEHVDLDQLALAGPLAMQQSRQRAFEGGVGGDRVDQILAGGLRRLARRGRPTASRPTCLQQQVLARIVQIGAVSP